MKRKMFSLRSFITLVLVVILAVSLAACGSQSADGTKNPAGSANALATIASEAKGTDGSKNVSDNKTTDNKGTDGLKKYNIEYPFWYTPPTEEQMKLAKLDDISGAVMSTGPHGEKPVASKDLQITDEDIAKLKAGKYTAGISMAFFGSEWASQQINGMKAGLEKFGIKVVAVTDAQFKDSQQIQNLQAMAAKKPNVILSHPVDSKTVASTYKKLSADGIKLVLLDNVGEEMAAGKDYVSVISADSFLSGMIHADVMAKAMKNKGKVGILYYAPRFRVTNQRVEGFMARMQAKYPDIDIVTAQPFQDPNNTQTIAAAMIIKYTDMVGLYTEWDAPALGAMAAARVAGKTSENFHIATDVMGPEVTLDLAKGGYIKGFGSQQPYEQGMAEAKCAALALLDKEVPAYVAVPPLRVERANLAELYEKINQKKPSQDVLDALKKQ